MPSILPGETKANKKKSQSGFLAYHQGGHNQTKLYLRIASIVLSIILIGLSVEDSKRTYEWHVITDNNPEAVTQSWWSTVPVALIALGFDGLELLFSALWKRNPGLHPGWEIGIELVMWGGLLFTITFSGLDIDYNIYEPNPDWVQSIKITLVTFLVIFFVIRLTLFVCACIDTHRHIKDTQLELIMEALQRRNNFSAAAPSSTASILHDPIHQQAIDLRNQLQSGKALAPLRELPQTTRYMPHELPPGTRVPHEIHDDTPSYPEFEGNQKFLVSDFPRRPYNR